MEYKIKTGQDGLEYAVFKDENSCSMFCDSRKIQPQTFCFSGYHNAILMADISEDVNQ